MYMGTMLLGKFKISRRQLFLWVTRNSGHGRKLDLNFLVPCCRGLKFFPNGLTKLLDYSAANSIDTLLIFINKMAIKGYFQYVPLI